jgi:choline dehydrogenase-like flavoprotein
MSRDTIYDFIIIGSGASGGVAAGVLQESGANCLLLESGTHYTKEDFPKSEADYTPELFWGGGIEYNTQCNLAFLRGRCVGGGTVINQALQDRFDDVALDDWRAESGVDFFSSDGMNEWYDHAEAGVTLETIPQEHCNNNALCFQKGMDNLGYGWAPLRRGQSDCGTADGNDCISCLGGCHRGSKQSTLETYIPRALAAGLTLISEFHVGRIEDGPDGVKVHGEKDGVTHCHHGAKVILAASSMGTTQLLLNSGFKPKLPGLGHGFSMHPQFMSFAVFDEPVDSHKGALQGVKSDDPGFRERGFKLENVFAQPISIAVLYQKTGPALHRFMRGYRNLACIEVAVRDENTGVIDTKPSGRLSVTKQLTDQDRRRGDDGLSVVRDLFGSLGAKEIIQCPWSFGLHLMGGCAMGTDGAKSVVNPEFQVHDHPNLYVSDSSVFPNAPGINPALTIMALSHKMARSLAG